MVCQALGQEGGIGAGSVGFLEASLLSADDERLGLYGLVVNHPPAGGPR